ncbi:hypothetical protein [Candidatus Phyllobacterium onerii]|uniref:hypothetical protein n=1 Tax=Candidatus Phyllobacterium onerii TaxID=3020828 RepID=UPI00232BFE53|nr:hypothetical protein [Phyllobacterium sp. IY22]
MKHALPEELNVLDRTDPDYPRRTLSRIERLERWIQLLERDPKRRLSTFHQTEFQAPAVRDVMRAEGSALAVAFEDPYLRASGLANDSYGEAKRYFEITDLQLHRMVCYCHLGADVSSGRTARFVRKLLAPKQAARFGWLRNLLAL